MNKTFKTEKFFLLIVFDMELVNIIAFLLYTVGRKDDWKTRKDFEKSDSGLIEILFLHLPAGSEDNHENDHANILAEIRNEQLPNIAMIYQWWITKDLKGSGRGLVKVIPRHLNKVGEESHENTITIAGIPVDVWTEHLRNTGLIYER
jgi:hypothetical protein